MSDRSWFYAAQGQQQGPFPEAQFRNLIARNTVTADTLVWTDGMAGWQRAGDIPGLMSGRSGAPASQLGGQQVGAGGQYHAGDRYDEGGGPLSIDFTIWEFVWRTLALLIGALFVIPLPWVVVMYCRWIVSRTRVPDRPNLTFTGQPMTILWWYLGAIALSIVLDLIGIRALNLITIFVLFGLYWLAIKWFFANLSSNGQPLGLGFSGSYWGYLGWNILAALSVITIIGWAWVITAQARWICRHIEGTRREVVFRGSGLEYLWRAVVTTLACYFIIPIPWVVRWKMRWLLSQTELVDRA